MREVPTYGRVTLQLERDPFEVLRMGTYVGTCYGLGGGFMFCAAAVALDVNKQVVFARDNEGRVLARQLVAISEDDQLVAHEVYPLSAQSEVQRLFRGYDLALAEALGLPLFESDHGISGEADEAGYVTTILARDYYDDGPWVPDELGRRPVSS